jgi:thiol-disulfide isomerase/thioredoxin
MLMLLTWLLTAAALPPTPAPEIDYGYWLANGPADPSTENQLAVVEVWATWCGPCHETFPKLTRLQKEYGDRIRVVALTDDRPEVVRRFFHKNRDQMRFAIAVTDSDTVKSLMFGGFEGRGLPSVYVIRNGKMLWSGAPDGLEHALATIVSRPAEAIRAPGWQTSDAEVGADGGTALFTLEIPAGHKVQSDAVDLNVIDSAGLLIGVSEVRLSGSLVEVTAPIQAVGLSGTDVELTVEISHHSCSEGVCYPRVTESLATLVHVQ